MELKKIAIAGAGGNVGSVVVNDLLATGQFEVTALVRPASQYPNTAPQGVRIVVADFEDRTSLTSALVGQDALLSLLPGSQTMLHHQKPMIDAAIAARLKLFFADEFSGNLEGRHYQHFPTSIVGEKLLVRKYLEEKVATKSICWTALNAGPFFDMWFKAGHAGFNMANHTARIYGSGNNLSCWTPIPIVSKAMVNMLRNPCPILNRAVFISGILGLTQNAILEALEEETRVKFKIEHIDLYEIKKDAFEALERGDLARASRGLTLNYNFNEDEGTSDFWYKVENSLVGVSPVTVQEAVKDILDTK